MNVHLPHARGRRAALGLAVGAATMTVLGVACSPTEPAPLAAGAGTTGSSVAPAPPPTPGTSAPAAAPDDRETSGAATGASLATRDLPDPSLLRVGSTFYAYGTGSGTSRVQVYRSSDLRTWEERPDALVEMPAWAEDSVATTWAPVVTTAADGFVMFVSVRERASGRMCIAQARAAEPAGPFRSANASPMLCQRDRGGSIDPEVFRDRAGQAYLLWKSDGNCCAQPSGLWAQPFDADLRALVDRPVQLVRSDRTWEAGVVEGPTVVEHDGRFVVLFSGGDWRRDSYATGYATCTSMTGPCVKADRPWLATDARWVGPGGATAVGIDAATTLLVFHSWSTDPGGARVRHLSIARLTFGPDGAPTAEAWS